MRTRIAVLVAVLVTAAFCVSLAFATGAAGPKSAMTLKAVDQVAAEDPRWKSELQYVNMENGSRDQAAGPAADNGRVLPLMPSRRQASPGNADVVKVLVVGDSFTVGHGLLDRSVKWGDLLQRVLDERYGPLVFTVDTLAVSGASVFDQAYWLEQGNFDFDVLVFAYVYNDPAFDQRVFDVGRRWDLPPLMLEQACGMNKEETQECYAASTDLPTSQDVAEDPTLYPWWEYFAQAVDSIAKSASGKPWLVFDTNLPAFGNFEAEQFLTVYEKAGAQLVPRPNTERAVVRTDVPAMEFYTMPWDGHPSPMVSYAYALDVAAALEEVLGPQRIGRAVEAAQAEGPSALSPLVVNYLPTALLVSSTPTTAEVTYRGDDPKWASQEGAIQQASPCMRLGHPYAHLTLSEDVVPGSTVTVALVDSGEALGIYAFGYDESMVRLYWPVGRVGPGESLSVTWEDETAGLLVVDESKQCSAPEDVRLSPFMMTLSLE